MSKVELLDAVQAARRQLLQAIEGLSPEETVQPATIGKWSVKEVLSHIAGWDIWMSATMRTIVEGNPPDLLIIKDFDAANAQFVTERADKSIEQILAEMEETHQKMLRFVEELSEEQITKRQIFEGQNWSVHTFLKVWEEHDPHHTDKILLWRKSKKKD